MAKRSSNSSLHSAKSAKNDEFYTQLSDIEKEVSHYAAQLKGKVIFCNCDDPAESNFFWHFCAKFKTYGIKKLITTHYVAEGTSYKMVVGTQKLADEITKHKRVFDFASQSYFEKLQEDGVITPLRENGDFRSQECLALLQQSDVVVTNPPFSLFREYVAALDEYHKKFLIVRNDNAIAYKDIFKLIMKNKIWSGYSRVKELKQPDGTMKQFGNVGWFTNLEVAKHNEFLTLYKTYTPKEYPKYDNYDAIEVSKVAEIPADYEGCMGVPITFLDKHNPKQFDIVKFRKGDDDKDLSIDGQCPYFRILIRHRR
ncbi:MAG: adenine-specific methyltransferase EcoRI family protein [Planctomycetaceae bacterium]|jgi:hypothetical protein|nr:adenine-specific methyltransferase EcoRI family protein [Planctomycetaceae bacterium]